MKPSAVILCIALLACGREHGATETPIPSKDPQDVPKSDPQKDPTSSLEQCVLSQMTVTSTAQQNVLLGVKMKKICGGSDETIQTIVNKRD